MKRYIRSSEVSTAMKKYCNEVITEAILKYTTYPLWRREDIEGLNELATNILMSIPLKTKPDNASKLFKQQLIDLAFKDEDKMLDEIENNIESSYSSKVKVDQIKEIVASILQSGVPISFLNPWVESRNVNRIFQYIQYLNSKGYEKEEIKQEILTGRPSAISDFEGIEPYRCFIFW